MFVPHFLSNRVPSCAVLLAGRVVVRITSVFGVRRLPKRLRPAACTLMTNVDFLVHRHELVVQVLPFRHTRRPCKWIGSQRASLPPHVAVPICRPPVWFFLLSCSDGVNSKRQSPALVCDRAAAGSDPVQTGLPPIRGRSENTFHVLRLPQHRTPGPTTRTRAS